MWIKETFNFDESKNFVLERSFKENPFFEDIAYRILNLESLDFESALKLYREGDLFFLGELARRVKEKIHGKKYYLSLIHI